MERVTSAIFVGRDQELDLFKSLLTPETTIKILNIHTSGEGGIGKTRLLLRMQEHCGSMPDRVVFAKDVVDFYHTESRSRLGVMHQIATNLNVKYFAEFNKLFRKFHDTEDESVRLELFPQIEKTFQDEYALFSANIQKEQKVIVLFFDTYEFIQSRDKEQKRAEPTEFSRWIETELLPRLNKSTCIIVSGRYPLLEIDRAKVAVKEYNLEPFKPSDTKAFWKKCFNLMTDEELVEKIGSEQLVETFHTLAKGHPILLALFADWVNYERNPLSPESLMAEIERRTQQFITPSTKDKEQKALFEKALIERIASLVEPEDRAVTYMAVAYRRMTPEMFHCITDLPLEECQETLLKKLKPLSFVKYKKEYKKEEVVILQDEMRRLVVQHWWEKGDAARQERKEIAKTVVQYYDNNLLVAVGISEEDREIYTSELLEYAFLADPNDGIDRFRSEFDIAIEDGERDYDELLLRETEEYRRVNPTDIHYPDSVSIDLRRIRMNIETGKYAEALRLVNIILDQYAEHPEWKKAPRGHTIYGHCLLAKGEAEFWLEDFEQAIRSFREAKTVYRDSGEKVLRHRADNWRGYAYFRQGNFDEAKRWYTRSQKEFSELLIQRGKLTKRERRRLFIGLRYALGNLALIYRYLGHSETAIRYAEISLSIVQHLLRNNREIARARTTISYTLEYAGRIVDARHNAEEAVWLLEQIPDRTLMGRVKTNLCWLHYRTKDLTFLLMFNRAEELNKIVETKGFIKAEDIKAAHKAIQEAIDILSKPPEISKELTDAYFALGELYMFTPSDMLTPPADHWQKAEIAFQRSLDYATKSQFCYREVDSLVDLVALYYFWNASGISDKSKTKNLREMQKYQEELKKFDKRTYPNLWARYEAILGDIEYDKAWDILRTTNEQKWETGMPLLKEAFNHYVKAADFAKKFNQERYYFILRIFYNRIDVLIPEEFEQLDELQSLWQGKSDFETIYEYVTLQTLPEKQLEHVRAKLDELQSECQEDLDKGNFIWAALLNDCLIGLYKELLKADPQNDADREQLILRLDAQGGIYRALGEEYQAIRYIQEARNELKLLPESHLKEGLEGFTDCAEGTLYYRRGEYGRPLEFYLREELQKARDKFDKQFPQGRTDALRCLQDAKRKLESAIVRGEKELTQKRTDRDRRFLEERIRRYCKNLGETLFRIGELLMMNERFGDDGEEKGAFSYLEEGIEISKKSEDTYRYDNARQSYLNALYFSGRYDDPAYEKKRTASNYEEELDKKLQSGTKIYPSIMGRMRIVQGDALFSSYFQRIDESHYVSQVGRSIDIPKLHMILRYYVEACNFMAQHSTTNFAVAVRILQRRIELISDRNSLDVIQNDLSDVWADQEHLTEKKEEELETLVQFVKIRSVLLEYEDNQ